MGERRTSTVVFTDVVGSTRLRTSFGDDAVDEMLARHDEIVREAATAHDGEVIKGTGDGSLVLFASARAGVRAAIDMQRRFAAAAAGSTGPPLAVRIGLHTGEVSVAGGDVLGEAVNAAARILGHADGGEIVASRVVRDLLGTSEVVLEDRGEHELRGFADPQQLFTVHWEPPAEAEALEVRLLGSPSMRRGGEVVPAFASSRLQRLVAALALEAGQPIPRSRIAFRLWPDSSESQARTNLRKLLHELRQAVPDIESVVLADTQHLEWRTDGPATVDLVELQAALERGDDDVAVSRYGGDLLPDEYDDWVVEARDRLRRATGEALARISSAAEQAGDHSKVIEAAEAHLRLDPYWEPAYQRLMRAHHALGNRAEAMRVYHRAAELLDRELGVEPDASTRRVYEEVRGHARTEAPPVASSPAWGASLVGRDVEMGRIEAAWREASAGRATLLLVTGEAGIGKSRLVDEFARSLHGVDAPRARAYEAAGRLPWGPVVEWLRSEPVRADLDHLEPAWRDALAVLLPELRSASEQPLRPTAAPGRSEVDPDRTQLFEAIAHTLVPRWPPRLLLIDDLQWCDTDTLELIGYLVARRPDSPLLVLGTVRSDEITDDHPLTRLLTGLGRTGSVTELPLAPLDAASTAELAHRLTGEDLSEHDAERLWRDTEGNPLFLVEAARAGLAADGRGTPLTPTIKATIASRLSHLGSDARELAELAAVIGREFTTELVVAASHLEESQVLDALDELWSRRIVTERGAAYDFTHDKVREVVHDGISPVRRRRHHRAVAAALAAATGADPGASAAVVAVHLEAAGQVAEAVEAHLLAAKHASAVVGLDEAIASCTRGLALLEQLPPGPERDQQELELRLVLGGPISSREGYGSPASVAVFDRALTLSRRLGRRVDPVILRGLGLAAVTACRFDRSRKFAQELVEYGDDPVSVTEGHYLLGVTAFWRAELEESDRELRLALDSYAPERGPIHRAYFAQDPKAVCTARLALTSLWRDDVDATRRLAAEAREYAESLDHPMTLGYVLVYTAMAATELDDREWLRRDAADETSLGGHGFGFLLVVEGLYDSWLAVLEGRDGSIAELEKAVANCRLEHQSLHLTYALSLLARAYGRDGAIDAGMAAVREGVEWGHAHDQRYAESLLCRVEGELHEAAGDPAAAERSYRHAAQVARGQGAHRFQRLAEDRLRLLGAVP